MTRRDAIYMLPALDNTLDSLKTSCFIPDVYMMFPIPVHSLYHSSATEVEISRN